MNKATGHEAYPLHWPAGWLRTKRPVSSRFSTSFRVARDGLFAEIKRLGGSQIVLSTNVALRQDGLPYASRSQPEDRGVAVYFLRNGRQMVFACDKWNSVEDNVHAIECTIAAIRGIERWGASEMMERAFMAFEALPPPRNCWDVLGISSTSDSSAISAAYRLKARALHPDVGGTEAAMTELNKARDEALKQVS